MGNIVSENDHTAEIMVKGFDFVQLLDNLASREVIKEFTLGAYVWFTERISHKIINLSQKAVSIKLTL